MAYQQGLQCLQAVVYSASKHCSKLRIGRFVFSGGPFGECVFNGVCVVHDCILTAKEVLQLLLPAAFLRGVVFAQAFLELAEQFFLLAVQIDRGFYHHVHIQVAGDTAAHTGYALAA